MSRTSFHPFHKNSAGAIFFIFASLVLTFLLAAFAIILTLPAFCARIGDWLGSLRSSLATLLKGAFGKTSAVTGAAPRTVNLPVKTGAGKHTGNSRRKPVFYDAGKWQKCSLTYLGGCACLFAAVLYMLPQHGTPAAAYYCNGPYARKPVFREYLDIRALPEECRTVLPLSGAVGFVRDRKENDSAAMIFRAPAIQQAVGLQIAAQHAQNSRIAAPRHSGPVIFNNGRIIIQTVAGDIVISAPGAGQADPLPAPATLFGQGDSAGLRLEGLFFEEDLAFSPLSGDAPPRDAAWAELMALEPEITIAQCGTGFEKPRADLSRLARTLQNPLFNGKYGLLKGRYQEVAKVYAQKYQLATSLLLAIMHTESGFNPSAVSPRQAIGLMQVVPHTAGNEVYLFLKGERGTPSADTLFNPENNIRYGATYLHLLDRYHFGGVTNSDSRLLCVIAGYNGGPNAVLRHFNSDRQKAFEKINAMTAEQIYSILTKRFPYAETRRYVENVKARMESYSAVY